MKEAIIIALTSYDMSFRQSIIRRRAKSGGKPLGFDGGTPRKMDSMPDRRLLSPISSAESSDIDTEPLDTTESSIVSSTIGVSLDTKQAMGTLQLAVLVFYSVSGKHPSSLSLDLP